MFALTGWPIKVIQNGIFHPFFLHRMRVDLGTLLLNSVIFYHGASLLVASMKHGNLQTQQQCEVFDFSHKKGRSQAKKLVGE